MSRYSRKKLQERLHFIKTELLMLDQDIFDLNSISAIYNRGRVASDILVNLASSLSSRIDGKILEHSALSEELIDIGRLLALFEIEESIKGNCYK